MSAMITHFLTSATTASTTAAAQQQLHAAQQLLQQVTQQAKDRSVLLTASLKQKHVKTVSLFDPIFRLVNTHRTAALAIAVAFLAIKALAAYRQIQALRDPAQEFVKLQKDGGHKSIDLYGQFVVNQQGLWLYTHTWRVANAKAVVFLVHGFGEHVHRYEHVAAFYNSKGYTVVAMDHQGHGQSQGRRAYVESFQHYANDTITVIKHFQQQQEFKNLPAFIFGHSMGGAITIQVCREVFGPHNQHHIKLLGAVLSAPAVWANPEISTPTLRAVASFFSQHMPKMIVNTLPITTLSTYELVRSQYAQDALNSRVGMAARWAVEITATMDDICANASTITFPFLLLHGTGDGIVSIVGSEKLQAEASSSDKTMIQYAGAGHEMHNDTCADKFLEDITSWMNKRIVK